jgi:hypothetical protein
MLYPIELWVLTEENFKFSPQKTDFSILLFYTVCIETSKTESKQEAQCKRLQWQILSAIQRRELLCQSPLEAQADLEVVENRPACGGKTAPGRLS